MTVSLRSTFSLTQLAILMLAVQALADHRPDSTGLHVWRSRDAHARRHTKRSACARAGAPSVASNSGAVSSFTPSSTPSSISPQDPASTGQSDPAIGYNLAGVGHWQVVTTSVWVGKSSFGWLRLSFIGSPRAFADDQMDRELRRQLQPLAITIPLLPIPLPQRLPHLGTRPAPPPSRVMLNRAR